LRRYGSPLEDKIGGLERPPILMPTGSYPFTLIFSKESTTRPVVGTPNLVAGLNCVKIIRFFNSAVRARAESPVRPSD
jgi:hypothetical protein